jgi:squalene-hopene/tetraprenyl-beta-curcumene cyclase
LVCRKRSIIIACGILLLWDITMNFKRWLIVASLGVCLGGCYQKHDVLPSTTTATQPLNSDLSTTEDADPRQPDPDSMTRRAAEFLWSKQADDGSWRSETYGLLGSGQSLTPFVVNALLQDSAADPPTGAIDSALKFMRSRIDERGVLGVFDPDILEYPNYSTAFALMCFKRAAREQDKPLIQRMENWLYEQQFCETNGFDGTSPAYGGWGFGGVHPPGETGHMDLAHTRYVLQALAMKPVDAPRLAAAQTRALRFLRMLQKHPDETRPQPIPSEIQLDSSPNAGFDGGFYFSPIVLRANKGRLETSGEIPYWRSYATATCDGLMALIATGVSRDDPRVTSAINWLGEHRKLTFPEGIPEWYEGENWRDAVYFYHLAVRVQSTRAMKLDSDQRQQIAQQVFQLQNEDGSFLNRKSSLMKEDDPIMCTALAIIALAKPSAN